MSVFKGAGVAIVTPMYDNEEVNYDKLGELLEEQIARGTDAIIICGTTGEASTLTHEEHLAVIKYAVEKVNHRVPVIAGTGSNATDTAIYLSTEAEKYGADALLLVTPYYNKTTQTGLIHHYEYLADRTELPVILYNVPSRTGLSFTAETYRILSQHPRINGTKEASGDFSLLAETIAYCGDELNVWSGNDDQTLPMLALGAKGLISVTSNLLPAPMAELTHSYFRGEAEQAKELQMAYLPLMKALFAQVNPIPIKAAMEELGLDSGCLRRPLWTMDPKPRKALRETLHAFALLP